MPKQSTLKKRIRDLEHKLAKTRHDKNVKGRGRRHRGKRKRCKPTPTPLYCNDGYDCCHSGRTTIRERCCDDTCYGGYGRTPCYDGCGPYGPYDGCGPYGPYGGCGPCGGYGPACGLPGPYPWVPAPYPAFPCVSVLPGAPFVGPGGAATLVQTSCLPTF